MGKLDQMNHRGEMMQNPPAQTPSSSSAANPTEIVAAAPATLEREAQAPTAPSMNDVEFYVRDSISTILQVFEPTMLNEVLCDRVPSPEKLRELALQYGGYQAELFWGALPETAGIELKALAGVQWPRERCTSDSAGIVWQSTNR